MAENKDKPTKSVVVTPAPVKAKAKTQGQQSK